MIHSFAITNYLGDRIKLDLREPEVSGFLIKSVTGLGPVSYTHLVCHKKQPYNNWLKTFTKKAVAIILVVSLVDLQLSYVLAFMGQVQIAESLSSTIASTIVGVMLGYFFKALFETFFEKREERLKQESEPEENTNYEEV